jgi:ABC-type antimicrobial peptide transport system permease subunit
LAQHAFSGGEPVGKRLWIKAQPWETDGPAKIVGVVGHVRHWGLAGDDQSPVRAQFYYPLAQVPDQLLRRFSGLMSIAVRTSIAPLNMVDPLRRGMRGVSGDQVLYQVNTLEQLVSDSLSRQRFLLLLFGIFAGLALLLACVGIYGVLAYLTSQRVPEIGVRMALGANPRDVLWFVLRQSLGMILVGIGLGTVSAWAAWRLLMNMVPEVIPTEPLTFSIMISVLVIAALLASYLPARRASRIDPLMALRQE